MSKTISLFLTILFGSAPVFGQLDSVEPSTTVLQIAHRKKDKVKVVETGDYLVIRDPSGKIKGNLSALEEPYMIIIDDEQTMDIRQVESIRLDHSLLRVITGNSLLAVGTYTTFLGTISGVVGVIGLITGDLAAFAVFGAVLLPVGLLVMTAGRQVLHFYKNGSRWGYSIVPIDAPLPDAGQ